MKAGISKVLFGLTLGGFLGLIDGFCEFLSRTLAAKMFDVLLASTGKGLLCGLIIGLVTFRQRSPLVSILTGMVIAVALSYLLMLRADKELLWSVMLPGALLGLGGRLRYAQFRAATRNSGDTIARLVARALGAHSSGYAGQRPVLRD